MTNLDYTSNYDILQLLSRRMKEYRLAARLSQREFAEKTGVSYTTICRFEQGKHPNISLNNFISLLRQVGMESRMEDVLPELPVPPMALREINKLIPKESAAMIPSINVILWGKPVGTLVETGTGRNRQICFYYDPSFIRNGIDIAPLRASINGIVAQKGMPIYPVKEKMFGGLNQRQPRIWRMLFGTRSN